MIGKTLVQQIRIISSCSNNVENVIKDEADRQMIVKQLAMIT